MNAKDLRPTFWGVAGVVAAVLLLPASPGCGERDEPPAMTKKTLPLTELPEPVSKAAAKELRGVKLSEAWKNVDREGKLHSYEIRGRSDSNGKIREARVSPTGEVLEVE